MIRRIYKNADYRATFYYWAAIVVKVPVEIWVV